METVKNQKYMGGLPILTVVIVVYNCRSVLEQTLLSVLDQKYTNIETIIIDGGSTDGTVDLIEKYDERIDYWISEPDEGVYDAMNKGIEVATGRWVYFLGAGDIMVNVVENIMPMFVDENVIYYGDVYRNDILKVYNGRYTPFRLSRISICHQAIFYPINAVKKYKFNTKYKVQADHNLNMQLMGDKEYKFKYFPVLIALYDGTGISSTTKDIPFFKDRLLIVKSNFSIIVYIYAFLRSVVSDLLGKNHLEKP